jgi:hypothetical protein
MEIPKDLERTEMKALQFLAFVMLFAISSICAAADRGRPIRWDSDPLTPETEINPFNILVQLNASQPIMDHLGEPHQHGHIIQVIQDGGNRIQDPPNPDGSPGGDDSLALGNFNVIQMLGMDYPNTVEGKTGRFYSQKYFIPFIRDAVYYLRVWEGDDVATAPYFQNSSEYRNLGNSDQGGGVISISPKTFSGPQELDWLFGKSIPRPEKKK